MRRRDYVRDSNDLAVLELVDAFWYGGGMEVEGG